MNHCLPQCAEKVKATHLPNQSEHCETVVFCPQCKQIVCIKCMICHFLNVRHEGLINYLELDNFIPLPPYLPDFSATSQSLFRTPPHLLYIFHPLLQQSLPLEDGPISNPRHFHNTGILLSEACRHT